MPFQQPQWMNPGGRFIASQTHNIPGSNSGRGGGGGLVSGLNSIAGLVGQGFQVWDTIEGNKARRKVTDAQVDSYQTTGRHSLMQKIDDFSSQYNPEMTDNGALYSREQHLAQGMQLFGPEAEKLGMTPEQVLAGLEGGFSTRNKEENLLYAIKQENLAENDQSKFMQIDRDQKGGIPGHKPLPNLPPVETQQLGKEIGPGKDQATNDRDRMVQMIEQETQAQLDQETPPSPVEPPPDAAEFSALAGVPVNPELLRGSSYEAAQKYKEAQPVMRSEPHPVYSRKAMDASRKAMRYKALRQSLEGKDPELAYKAMLMSDKAIGDAIENDLYANFGAIPERLAHYGPKQLQDIAMGLYMQYRPHEIADIKQSLKDQGALMGKDPEKYANEALQRYTDALDVSFQDGAFRMFKGPIGNALALTAESADSFKQRILDLQKVAVKRDENLIAATGQKLKVAEMGQLDRHHTANLEMEREKLAARVGTDNAQNIIAVRTLGLEERKLTYMYGDKAVERAQEMLIAKMNSRNIFNQKMLDTLTDKNADGFGDQINRMKGVLELATMYTEFNNMIKRNPSTGEFWTSDRIDPDAKALWDELEGQLPADVRKNGTPRDKAIKIREMIGVMYRQSIENGGVPTSTVFVGPDGNPIKFSIDPNNPEAGMQAITQLFGDLGAEEVELKKMQERMNNLLHNPEVSAKIMQIAKAAGRDVSPEEWSVIAQRTGLVMEDYPAYRDVVLNGRFA